MGQRGPAATPLKVLEARGSWRAHKPGTGPEPQFEPGVPSCPAWLQGEARAEWKRQAPQLDAAGLIQKPDRAQLAQYCEAWGEYVALVKRIAEQVEACGWEQVAHTRLMKARDNAAMRVVRLADRFGFSPSARARVRAPQGEGSSNDKARFF